MMRIRQLFRHFIIALTFFTRIPLPAPQQVTQEEFHQSQSFYPLVGLVLGGLLWSIYNLLTPYYPPFVTGALILVAELILTGGLHLDGFMDSMDGLLSARTKERMLEIMKDSHVGAHATMSVIGLLILKFSLLSSLTSITSIILILMPVVSRWFVLFAIFYFPYARAEGLGKGFHEKSRWLSFFSVGIAIMLLSFWLLPWAGPLSLLITFALLFLFLRHVASLLGGLTGDIYGAAIEISEVLFLFVAFPLVK